MFKSQYSILKGCRLNLCKILQSIPAIAGIGVLYLLLFAQTGCGQKGSAHNQKDSTGAKTITLPAPTPLPTAEANRLRRAVQGWYDSILKPVHFEGGILVAKGGNPVFEQYTLQTPGVPRDSSVLHRAYHIASVSKTLTGMAVVLAAQENKLALDSPFHAYFPGFPYPGVTVRTLLNHRSGLPNYVYFMEELGWDIKIPVSNADVLQALIQQKASIKNIGLPDTYFSYCNTNYVLLALLLEKVYGKPFPRLMKDHIFTPLGMHDTYVFTRADSGKAPLSYDWRGQAIELNHLDYTYGDKNIYSTPRDLLRWDRALKPGILLQKEWLEQAYTGYSNERPGVRNYGLGWRLNVLPNGEKLVYHNGWWHGNNAAFIRMIPEDATIIVLGNRFTRNVYKSKYLCGLFNKGMGLAEEEAENGPGSR